MSKQKPHFSTTINLYHRLCCCSKVSSHLWIFQQLHIVALRLNIQQHLSEVLVLDGPRRDLQHSTSSLRTAKDEAHHVLRDTSPLESGPQRAVASDNHQIAQTALVPVVYILCIVWDRNPTTSIRAIDVVHIALVNVHSASSFLDLKGAVAVSQAERSFNTHTYHWIQIGRCTALSVLSEVPQSL